MADNLPAVLTIQETAKYLRIPLRSIYKLAQESRIPCQKVGKQWRFRKEALDRWLENYQVVVLDVNQVNTDILEDMEDGSE